MPPLWGGGINQMYIEERNNSDNEKSLKQSSSLYVWGGYNLDSTAVRLLNKGHSDERHVWPLTR